LHERCHRLIDVLPAATVLAAVAERIVPQRQGVETMVDFGVAVAWIAISAASAKGLTAFGRAAAASCLKDELAWPASEGMLVHDGFMAHLDAPASRLGELS
jgi:hypothetical protein